MQPICDYCLHIPLDMELFPMADGDHLVCRKCKAHIEEQKRRGYATFFLKKPKNKE